MKFNIKMYGFEVETEDKEVYDLLTYVTNELEQSKRIILALLDLRGLEKDK